MICIWFSLCHYHPIFSWFHLSGAGLPRLSWKRGHEMGVSPCYYFDNEQEDDCCPNLRVAFLTGPNHHNRFSALFQDHPGKLVPEENFWTLWCEGRLTEADGEWLDILWCSVCLCLTFVTFFVKKCFFSAYQV